MIWNNALYQFCKVRAYLLSRRRKVAGKVDETIVVFRHERHVYSESKKHPYAVTLWMMLPLNLPCPNPHPHKNKLVLVISNTQETNVKKSKKKVIIPIYISPNHPWFPISPHPHNISYNNIDFREKRKRKRVT